MTGTESRVNTWLVVPQVTPQATLRPVRASSSRAISMRAPRVSSRNRVIRPASASGVSAPSGAGMVPWTRISSRSTVTSTEVNQSAGSRPVSQSLTLNVP